jgi:hypothetical protein
MEKNRFCICLFFYSLINHCITNLLLINYGGPIPMPPDCALYAVDGSIRFAAYSFFKFLTGLADAALITWKPIVANAIASTRIAVKTKTVQLI